MGKLVTDCCRKIWYAQINYFFIFKNIFKFDLYYLYLMSSLLDCHDGVLKKLYFHS